MVMFYEQVHSVSPQRHGNWCVETNPDHFDFARAANSVPLAAVEIPHAAREYTVVFASAGDEVMPVVILSVKDHENLYLTDAGGWAAKYIPAFVRRYPFVFSENKDHSQFTLCLDESWDGFNQEGRGERLFDKKGRRTPFLERLLNFLKDFQRDMERTKGFCRKLKQLDLLEAKQAEFTLRNGEKRALRGFMAVSREKLHALPAETLQELAKSGVLELIYAHLLSMNNLSLMLQRAQEFAAAHTE